MSTWTNDLRKIWICANFIFGIIKCESNWRSCRSGTVMVSTRRCIVPLERQFLVEITSAPLLLLTSASLLVYRTRTPSGETHRWRETHRYRLWMNRLDDWACGRRRRPTPQGREFDCPPWTSETRVLCPSSEQFGAGRREGDEGPGFGHLEPAAFDRELLAGAVFGWRSAISV